LILAFARRLSQNSGGRSLGERAVPRGDLRAIVDDLRSQGFTSVRAIAAQLNERGILTPRGGAWHPTSAARLLSRLQV